MKLKFTKSQIQILAVLHLIILILFVGILFLPKDNKSVPTDATPEPEPAPFHDKYRDARVSFDQENYFFETNIGGSGFERVERAYPFDDSIYIVGTSNSVDYDFEGSGGNIFIVKMSIYGKPEKYLTLPGILIKSFNSYEGILLLYSHSGKYKLASINLELGISKEKELELDGGDKVLDIFFNGNYSRINLLIRFTQTSPKKDLLRVLALDDGFLPIPARSFIIENELDLSFIKAFDTEEGYVIAANVSAAETGNLIIFEWLNLRSPQLKSYPFKISGKKYAAIEISMYENGWVGLLTDENKTTDIFTLSTDFSSSISTLHLNIEKTSVCNFYFDGGYFYIYSVSSDTGSRMLRLNSNLKNPIEFRSFENYEELNSFCPDSFFCGTFFGGILDSSPCISFFSGDTVFQKQYGNKTEKIISMIPYNDFIMLIGESSGTSIEVGKNFGNTDIWVTKIRY